MYMYTIAVPVVRVENYGTHKVAGESGTSKPTQADAGEGIGDGY